MSSFEELAASAAYHFERNKPMIPMYIHLILSALFPIVTGAFASLSRPSSAAPKPSKKKGKHHDEDEDDEEDEVVQQMEGLTPKDAIMFPIMAGTVLAGLYWLIKRYGADAINLVMGYYFACVGLFSVAKLFNDGSALVLSLVFPTYFSKWGRVWKIKGNGQAVVQTGTEEVVEQEIDSPLPGLLGSVPLPKFMLQTLWEIRSTSVQKYRIELYGRNLFDIKAVYTVLNVLSTFAGLGAIAYNHFIAKPWWLTNIQGFAVSYSAMQFMSPTTFATGSLILSGLFFYDIWAVFFTPLMVTVAKNLDQPIKLMFPRPDEPGAAGEPPVKSYGMLGLGDIVLPGLIIGLALRFDHHMYYLKKQQKVMKANAKGEQEETVVKPEYFPATGHFGSRLWTAWVRKTALPPVLSTTAFPKPYFVASLVGYVVGMLATLGVMAVFQHAQPALLYLVPAVLISTWSTALVRGELKDFWNYTEAVTGEAEDSEEQKKKREESESKKKAEQPAKDEASNANKSWWDVVHQTVLGAAKKVEEKAKMDAEAKAEDEEEKERKKSVSMLEKLAKERPDELFVLKIKPYPFPSSAHSQAESSVAKSEDPAEDASEKSVTDDKSKSDSRSEPDEDAVLVSKDEEAANGPAQRTRNRKPRLVQRV